MTALQETVSPGQSAPPQVSLPGQAQGPDFVMDDMRFFAREAMARAGILLREEKAAFVFRRLAPRVRQLGLGSFAAYRARLEGADEAEWSHVIGLLTTNHSRFFREIHHLKLLGSHLEKRIAGGATRLRLWSAACAAGQEPYSMAMLAAHLKRQSPALDIKVLATDIDADALAEAEAAVYPAEELAELPRFARPFARPAGDGKLAVAEEARALVRFRPHNLTRGDWPMRGPFDVIFCRNALIYFSAEDQRRVVSHLAERLERGGILCLGHSEVTRDPSLPLRRIPVASSYVRV